MRVYGWWYGYVLNTLFTFQIIIRLRTRRVWFSSRFLWIRKLSLDVVGGVLRPCVHLLPRTMLSRPRGLRLLYISLAACVLLGLYWLATSEDGAVSREFRQPSPLQQQQDYYGRGMFIRAPLGWNRKFFIQKFGLKMNFALHDIHFWNFYSCFVKLSGSLNKQIIITLSGSSSLSLSLSAPSSL